MICSKSVFDATIMLDVGACTTVMNIQFVYYYYEYADGSTVTATQPNPTCSIPNTLSIHLAFRPPSVQMTLTSAPGVQTPD